MKREILTTFNPCTFRAEKTVFRAPSSGLTRPVEAIKPKRKRKHKPRRKK